MTTLVFFLEEASAKAMLESFLPGILPSGYDVRYIVFEGKSDLDRRLVQRLRGWQKPDCKFVVLRDQDSANCDDVKLILRQKCNEGGHPETLVRIACHELESWYLGDLQAVEKGLGLNSISQHQRRIKFRNPDSLNSPANELEKITKRQYQKISGSREIGKYLNQIGNTSHSFNVFYQGLCRLWQDTN